MHIHPRLLALALSFFSLATLAAQRDDGGYTRQLTEAQKELKVDTLSSNRLVELLGDKYFYYREAATIELSSRGVTEYEAIITATGSSDPEVAARANRILGKVAGGQYYDLRQKHDPKISLTISNPRFWAGNNAFRGGIPDTSLDADVAIKSDIPVEGITSPLPVKTGKTNIGEKVETLPWSSSHCSTTSGVVYLTKPQFGFDSIEATLLVHGIIRLPPEKISKSFAPAKEVVCKDRLWWELAAEKDSGKFTIVATDVLGRLERAEVKLFEADGKAAKAKIEMSRGGYRRVWFIDTDGGKKMPASFQLHVPGPALYVEKAIKVSVPHPPGPKMLPAMN